MPRKTFDPLLMPRVGFHEERVNRTTHITTKAKCARADGNASCAVVIASTGNDKPILSRWSNGRFAPKTALSGL
jgi:hypothetical protein